MPPSAAGTQQFGTGSASIRVTQDLQLARRAAALVREGDQFSALLTLRNTTAREMTVHASLAGVVNTSAGGEIVRTRSRWRRSTWCSLPVAAKELVCRSTCRRTPSA